MRKSGVEPQLPSHWFGRLDQATTTITENDVANKLVKHLANIRRINDLPAQSFQPIFYQPIDGVVLERDNNNLILKFKSGADVFWLKVNNASQGSVLNLDWSCTLPLESPDYKSYRHTLVKIVSVMVEEIEKMASSQKQIISQSQSAIKSVLKGQQRTPEQKAREKAEAKARPAVEVTEPVVIERRNEPSEMQHLLLNSDDVIRICQEAGIQESTAIKIAEKINRVFNRKSPVLSELKKIIATRDKIDLFRLDVGFGYRAIFTQATGKGNITKWLLVDFDRRDSVYKPEAVANLADKASGLLKKYNQQQ